jgi:hypothetical protein
MCCAAFNFLKRALWPKSLQDRLPLLNQVGAVHAESPCLCTEYCQLRRSSTLSLLQSQRSLIRKYSISVAGVGPARHSYKLCSKAHKMFQYARISPGTSRDCWKRPSISLLRRKNKLRRLSTVGKHWPEKTGRVS